MKALNIGSGQRPFTTTPEIEWCNVDKLAHEGMPKPDLIADGGHLPFPDESADFVVLHHVAEHFHCGESAGLIQEAWRLLKPKGSLLVFVPDLRELAIAWLTERLTTQIYVTNLYGAYMGHPEDCHYWGFDQASLVEFLDRTCPWSKVGNFDWRAIPGADIARDFWIANAECVK